MYFKHYKNATKTYRSRHKLYHAKAYYDHNVLVYVTGSGKTDQLLAQAIIFAIYIPDDRAKNCLRIDMLSLHIPCSMPELCVLETQSCKTAVLRNAHSKIAKLGKVR